MTALPASRLDRLAFDQSGVLTTRQAVESVGHATVRRMVRSGRWRTICRGILATTNGRLTRDQQLWVAVLAAGRGALLAGATAALESGVRGLQAEPIYVLVSATRVPSGLLRHLPIDMPAVVVHRTTVLPDDHIQVGRPMRTTTPRSLVDAAAWARSDDDARVALAAGCQQRRVLPGELREVVSVLPRLRRRRIILETIGDLEGAATALSEIDFVRLCRRYRLPRPDLQERRVDASGRLRFLDAYWREWHLHAEVDGAHHMEVRHWEADMRRQNDVWIKGDRTLRFPASWIRSRPDDVAAQLRRALEAAGWSPPAQS
ncbi:type IV toxin-antitoxin system AbiEi family antitoxin domain-containing protein [Phytohabitans aurantiacus]|uniref:AbiEi antitoxin N-terminal domain-containing protein n=1 Tax=Phytohabitans aurantiacus TaxID=3016789 RepID=A0ABQ5QUX6_9ACTN|nr:type IV toxin-antitoxin system AbiEi family antitoxin domain-containing protein [Phytohabitans aurantiacus]GLH98214.1 hypothetical protein Pa4123_34890 [Phytohabitans aurantiacus]